MANYNKAILIGHITRDIELKFTTAQKAVVDIGLAVSRKWSTGAGEEKSETLYIDCVAYSSGAETLAKYCKKGDLLLVEGRLCLQQWNDKEGNKRSRIHLAVDNFQFLQHRNSKPEDTATTTSTQTDDEPF